MYMFYFLEAYEYFDHFVRVIANKKSYKERGLARNIVFNLIRSMFNETFRHYVLHDHLSIETYIMRATFTVVVTIAV